jgi:hypothetical protein
MMVDQPVSLNPRRARMTTSFDQFDPGQYLTPAQLVERWKGTAFPAALVTLARWRARSRGPEFIKFGHNSRLVYYPLSGIESYEQTLLQTVNGTH